MLGGGFSDLLLFCTCLGCKFDDFGVCCLRWVLFWLFWIRVGTGVLWIGLVELLVFVNLACLGWVFDCGFVVLFVLCLPGL